MREPCRQEAAGTARQKGWWLLPRHYIKVDPALADRKAHYPDGALAAFVECLCLAEFQPTRGRFRNVKYLRALLDRRGRWISYLIKQGDLRLLEGGRVYVEGWDEWQEGDLTVAERMQRVRDGRTARGLRRDGSGPLLTAHATAPTVADATACNGPDRLNETGQRLDRDSTENLSDENLSVSVGSREERADIQALLDRGWRSVTQAQRRVLDEILARHDLTGPGWSAQIVATTPRDQDPLAAVLSADRAWQADRRAKADAAERAASSRKRDEQPTVHAGLAQALTGATPSEYRSRKGAQT